MATLEERIKKLNALKAKRDAIAEAKKKRDAANAEIKKLRAK